MTSDEKTVKVERGDGSVARHPERVAAISRLALPARREQWGLVGPNLTGRAEPGSKRGVLTAAVGVG